MEHQKRSEENALDETGVCGSKVAKKMGRPTQDFGLNRPKTKAFLPELRHSFGSGQTQQGPSRSTTVVSQAVSPFPVTEKGAKY